MEFHQKYLLSLLLTVLLQDFGVPPNIFLLRLATWRGAEAWTHHLSGRMTSGMEGLLMVFGAGRVDLGFLPVGSEWVGKDGEHFRPGEGLVFWGGCIAHTPRRQRQKKGDI